MSLRARLLTSLASISLALLFAAPAVAQCNTSDGLDAGPACSGTWINQPQSWFSQQAVGINWLDCGVGTTAPYFAVWGNLNPILSLTPPAPSCGWYHARLQLYKGLQLAWQGPMYFAYSRTWQEVGGGGVYQVWRYLVNGDVTRLIANPGPGPLAPCCAPNGNKVHFSGYVDYAVDCSIPGLPIARSWMITHGCDAIDHVAGSPRAGTFHPNRFYSFVGPSAGFVVGAGSTLEVGGSAVECIRKWDAFFMPAHCDYEEPLLFANFNPNTTLCLCGVGPSNWYEAFFTAAGGAGSTLGPFLGSAPFRSYPIGQWTNPNVFPGVEEVRWNTNELLYQDCTGFMRQEFYYGVTTAGGFAPFQITSLVPPPPPMPLPSTFIDQSNSMKLPANLAIRNVPYRSDHILNLNL